MRKRSLVVLLGGIAIPMQILRDKPVSLRLTHPMLKEEYIFGCRELIRGSDATTIIMIVN